VGARAVILKSETYNFHRLDLTRQAGFIVTIYDEDGLRLAATMPFSTPAEAFGEARKIVDNRVEGPRNGQCPLLSNRWGNRPANLWIAEDFGCCASG
jgi:hypothetical protein